MYCKLCDSADATKIDSHIFTHAFIKSMINPLEIKKRGYGSSFEISSTDFINFFFERRVDGDRVQDILNRNLTDEEIKSLSDHYARKFILCSKCEGKLERIENYFIDNVYLKLFERKNQTTNKGELTFHTVNGLNNPTLKLFFLSIIWRASLVNFAGFKLRPKEEKKILKILKDVLCDKIEETIEKATAEKDTINYFPLLIYTSQIFCDPTSNVLHIDRSNVPYFLSINEYFIVFGSKIGHIKSNSNHFYGLSNLICDESLNFDNDEFVVTELSPKRFHDIKFDIFKLLADRFMNELRILFRDAYKKFHQSYPTEERFLKFRTEVINTQKPIPEIYSYQNIMEKLISNL